MAIMINGIECQEIVRGFSEAYELGKGPEFRKGFLCAWGSRFQVAQGLLGLSSTLSVGGLITFETPLQYPELSTAFVYAIDIEPVGTPTQGPVQIEWTDCIVWASYHSMPWNWSGIDYNQINPATPFIYARQNIKFTTQTITIPGRYCWFQSAGKLLGQDYGFPISIAELEITLIRIPYLPAQQIIAAQQAPLNSVAFLGCAPGTLFFRGGDNHQTFDTAGNHVQDLTLNFSYRPIAPWDQAWNGSAWDTVVIANGSSTAFIQRSDLSQLIPSYYYA